MAWTGEFLGALVSPRASLVYTLETSNFAPYQDGYEAGFFARSAAYLGAGYDIDTTRIEMQGSVLRPQAWASPWSGSWSVVVLGENAALALRLAVTRGSYLVLRAGPAGTFAADLEVIAMGIARQVQALGGNAYQLTCDDASTSLNMVRRSTASGRVLFELASSTLSADSAVADGTYDVTSTTGMEYQASVGGLVLIETSSGDAYYRKWSAKTGTTLTILAAGTASVFGTTDIGAVSGNTIRGAWYMAEHPLNLAKMVMVSTGTSGTYGAWDLLPASWGMGYPEWTLDLADIDRHRSLIMVPSSGTFVFDVFGVEVVDDPAAWIAALLGKAGAFITTRQGLVTFRALSIDSAAVMASLDIDDADIEVIESHEWFEPGHGITYDNVRSYGATTSTAVTNTGKKPLPGATSFSLDASDVLWANESAVTSEISSRVAKPLQRIPERLVLRCTGLRMAQLAAGDRCYLTTTRAVSRTATSGVFDRTMVLVDEVSPSWGGCTVRVGVLVYPADTSLWSSE
jgi:hypothetical protein